MEIRIPEVGESVFEALVSRWHKNDGERVAKNETVCEIETDKITLEIAADGDGILRIAVPAGTTVKVGAVIGTIEEQAEVAAAPAAPVPAPLPTASGHVSPSSRKQAREKKSVPERKAEEKIEAEVEKKPVETPVVRSEPPTPYKAASSSDEARITRTPMTPIRKRIAERLMAARLETAMLTSFNEADMSRVLEIRQNLGEDFQLRHGVKLGFMSFFVKACCEALMEFPAVNARIDGDDIVSHHFCDVGIAVSTEKGLVVPVVRNAEKLRFAEIEQGIAGFAEKIRTNRLAISDLEGGTFTITNGGVFGSLMSTPIINPPQSGVLGMHTVQERPVVRDGQIVIRPMMYLALSYDHRIIDGREAVLFLKKVKAYIEEPEELLLEG